MLNFDITLNHPVPQSFKCQLYPKEVSVLLAKSGVGKTTLMNAISGIIPAQGTLTLNNDDKNLLLLPIHKRPIAYVTQLPILFSHLTIGKLINLIEKQQQFPFDINWALEPMGLSDMLSKYPDELSGGQQKRLAIILAMIKKAPLLLLDEIFSGLDKSNLVECQKVIKTFLNSTHSTALMTSHQEETLIDFADHAFVAEAHDNRILWRPMTILAGLAHYNKQLTAQQAVVESIDPLKIAMPNIYLVTLNKHLINEGLTCFQLGEHTLFGSLQSEFPESVQTYIQLIPENGFLSKQKIEQTNLLNELKVIVKDIQVHNKNKNADVSVLLEFQNTPKSTKLGFLYLKLSAFELSKINCNVNDICYLYGNQNLVIHHGIH